MNKLRIFAWIAIAAAICCQLFNDIFCYEKSISEILLWLWFPLLPLIPAIVFVRGEKPIRAITAALVIIPFYCFAYYADCVLPYAGGGASMVYVIVVMFGTPIAICAGLLTSYIADKLAA